MQEIGKKGRVKNEDITSKRERERREVERIFDIHTAALKECLKDLFCEYIMEQQDPPMDSMHVQSEGGGGTTVSCTCTPPLKIQKTQVVCLSKATP